MSEISTTPPADFAALRSDGFVYVDRTEQMVRLAKRPCSQFFLARPRGFGKTLLLSGFEALFRGRLKLFKGLAAERLWRERSALEKVLSGFLKDGSLTRNAADTYTVCLAHLARKGNDSQGYLVLGCPNREVAHELSRL